MSDPLKHVRAIRAIADALGIKPVEVPAFLARLWKGWENHPVYPEWYKSDETGFTPRFDLYNPVAVAVFEHERGKSYLISDLQDLIASLEWGKRNLGDFAGIVPIPPDFPASRWHTLVWGQSSPRGRGNAYLCRQALKKYLPSRLHRWVNRARWYNARPKSVFLEPGEQTTKTKKEIFVERLPPDAREEIARYIALDDFWRAATGRVRAEEVPGLFRVRQMELWEGNPPGPAPGS